MADEATTSDASQDSQAQGTTDENPVDNTAELEKEATTEAVEPSEDTSQSSEADETESEEESGNSEEAEIREWAAKKNLPLEDPLKIAKMYREAERELGKKGQEAGQLKDAVTTANSEADVDEIQALKNEFAALNFKVSNNVTPEEEKTMVEILDERPWLAGDLPAVLEQAQGRLAKTEAQRVLEARKAGGKEALATVAQRESAAAPKSSASTRETPAQFLTDEEVGRLTPQEYQEAKAAGKIQY